MNLNIHKMTPQMFAQLAEGGGGVAGARCLLNAQRSKHFLLLRRVVDLARSSGNVEADLAQRAYDQLAAFQDVDPGAVEAVVRHPAVGAWARQALDSLVAAERGNELSWVSTVVAAAAIRAHIPFSAELPPVEGRTMFPSLGRAVARSGSVRVIGSGVVEVDGVPLPDDLSTETANWQGLRRLSAKTRGQRIELVVDDLDPYRAPGVENLGDRLDATEVARWQTVLDEAWDLLVREHAAVAEEVATMIRVVTPLRPPPGNHISATSRHAFGAILLSTPPDAVALAVTMAHEVQHAKLSALLDLIPMTVQDDDRLFYAPWREDPRPIYGLLQGAYAFLGVAGFWLQHGRLSGEEAAFVEFARWLAAVRLVVDTLSTCGGLTDAGTVFVSGMDRTLRRWETESLPGEALAAGRQANEEHREQWRQRNGEIPSSIGKRETQQQRSDRRRVEVEVEAPTG